MRCGSLKVLGAGLLCASLLANLWAQTDGEAKLEVTLLDYNGSSTRHYTVVWVTTEAGTFIKTLRKQGPGWTSGEWADHCGVWNTARAGSTVLDGYTSATAQNYSGTNSPVILNWNGRNAANNLMPDGNYKFWVQYAENQGQGPVTTGGLLWTKGSSVQTKTYPNQASNFSDMRVTWTPAAPQSPPEISSVQLSGDDLVLRGTGPANSPFSVQATTDLNGPAWTSAATGTIDAGGQFQVTLPSALSSGANRQFYRVSVP